MIEPTDRHCSSTAFEVLGGLWLKDTLVRIEHKLDLILKSLPTDFSVEDAQVKAMTEQSKEAKERVEEAKQRLPK